MKNLSMVIVTRVNYMMKFIFLMSFLPQSVAWSAESTQNLPVNLFAKSVAYLPQLNAGSIKVNDYKLQDHTALYLSAE